MEKLKKSKRLLFVSTCAIVILFFIFGIFATWDVANLRKADAATLSSNTARSDVLGELLLSGDKRKENVVFNGDVLKELYNKLVGVGATNATIDDVYEVAKEEKTGNHNIHAGKNSGDIRKDNNNKDIIVKVGNINWIVTSLTVDDSGKNAVLTLWIEDTADVCKWNLVSAEDIGSKYPSSLYSTSYIRARLLDGFDSNGDAVDYLGASGATTLTPYQRPEGYDYPYDIFTKSGSEGSITDYIVKPVNIPYQHTENRYDLLTTNGSSVGANRWYSTQNDSLSEIPASKWTGGMNAIQSKDKYTDWGNDYLWIPSHTELGWSHNTLSSVGVWNMDNINRGSSKRYWTRSVWHTTTMNSYAYNENGIYDEVGQNLSSNNNAVRPAFHLNLSLADEHSTRTLAQPKKASVTYKGANYDINDTTWHTLLV